MAASHSIDQFPTKIDRHQFGAYVSGFVDGEGHFGLGFSAAQQKSGQRTPKVVFSLGLRADDHAILRLIQSYFQCGRLYFDRKKIGNPDCPRWTLEIHRVGDCATILLPHFDRYPLFAKKRRDLRVWSEAVRLMSRVMSRPRHGLGYARGTVPRWTAEELAHFSSLNDAIKALRIFDSVSTPLPPPLAAPASLFDGLD